MGEKIIMGKQIVTPEQKQEIINLRKQGLSYKKISQQLKLCTKTISKYLKGTAYETEILSPKKLDKVIDLLDEGWTIYQISKKENLSVEKVKKILKRKQQEDQKAIQATINISERMKAKILKNQQERTKNKKRVGDRVKGGLIIKEYPTYYLIQTKNYKTTLLK